MSQKETILITQIKEREREREWLEKKNGVNVMMKRVVGIFEYIS